MISVTALRGSTISFRGDPFLDSAGARLVHIEDALIVTEGGRIQATGPYLDLIDSLPSGVIPVHYPDAIISVGFVDAHVHYPQLEMMGAYGAQLLDWLDKYTFVTEQKFANKIYASMVAKRFLNELLRVGTTTAAVYCTVHPQSVDAFFEESERLGTCMVAGKILMDRNAPAALLDTAQRGYDESEA